MDDDDEPYEPPQWRRRAGAVTFWILVASLFAFGLFILTNEWPKFDRELSDPWSILGWFSLAYSALISATWVLARRRAR